MPDPQIQALTQELGNLTQTLRNLVGASSKTVQAQIANQQALLDQREELELFKDQLKKTTKLSKEQVKLEQEAIKRKKEEQKAAREYVTAQSNLTKITSSQRATAAQQAAAQRTATRTQQQYQRAQAATRTAVTNFNVATQNASSSLTALTKSSTLVNAALVWFGSSLKTQARQLVSQVKANNGVIEGTDSVAQALFAQQNTALKYKLAGDQFAQITNQSRQMFNAMGGTARGMEQLQGSVDRLYILTGGDAADSLRLAAEGARYFAEKGVRPTTATMATYQRDLETLAKQTGMNVDQAQQFYQSVLDDIEVTDQLRSARKEERVAILTSNRAMLQQAIAAGMSAEQAREAAKMLNKMVAAKPLERLKQAAKVRALSGAMGIQGGEAAAQAIIAGKRATVEQKQALIEFSQNAANVIDKMAGQGLGAEIFSTALLDKLDLDQYYGKGSVFSTTLGDTLAKPLAGVEAAMKNIADDKLVQAVGLLKGIYDQAALIVSGQHWLGPIFAAGSAIAAYFLGGKFIGTIASSLSSTVGRMTGMMGSAAPAAAGAGRAAAGAGGVMSKIASAGKIAGIAGSALDVGFGLSDLLDGKRQTEMSGLDYISPMRWGMYAGEKINKGAESLMGGQSIGSKIYDMIHGDDVGKALTTPTPMMPKTSGTDAMKKTVGASDEMKVLAATTADGVSTQVRKMDTSNDLLRKQTDMMERQTELMEKQLIAMTLTDKEKKDNTARSTLRKDNKFGSQYNYV